MSNQLLAPPIASQAITIVELNSDDRDLIIDVFERLSDIDRFYRFFMSVPVYSNAMLEMLTGMNGTDHVAVGAFSEGTCVGIARYVRPAGSTGAAELAVVVSAEARGLGLSRRMLAALDAPARAKGWAAACPVVQGGRRCCVGRHRIDSRLVGLLGSSSSVADGIRTRELGSAA